MMEIIQKLQAVVLNSYIQDLFWTLGVFHEALTILLLCYIHLHYKEVHFTLGILFITHVMLTDLNKMVTELHTVEMKYPPTS